MKFFTKIFTQPLDLSVERKIIGTYYFSSGHLGKPLVTVINFSFTYKKWGDEVVWECSLDAENNRLVLERNGKINGYYELLKEPYCENCSNSKLIPTLGGKMICLSCRDSYGFERAYAVGPYYTVGYYQQKKQAGEEQEHTLSKHIYWFKKKGYFYEPLGLSMTLCIGERYGLLDKIDLIVGVPAHPEKNEERGFDQVEKLCNNVAKYIANNFDAKISFDNSILEKTKNISMVYEENGALKARPPNERYELVKGLYATTKEVDDKRILLIDDIYTTGANASECSEQLLEAGAESVNVMVLGRTID